MARLRIVRAAPVLTRWVVSPADAEIEVGQTVQYTVEGFDQHGSPMDASGGTWISSDPVVARIDASGLAEGLNVGEVEVDYTINGQTSG